MDKELINQLVKRIGIGDDDAFTELYNGMFSPLYSFLIPMVNNRNDILDVIQETFEAVIVKSKGKVIYSNCFSWIFTIAKNKAINFGEKKSRERPCQDKVIDSKSKKSYNEQEVINRLDLKYAMEKLSTIEQQIVRLYYNEDYTYKDLSKILHKSESAIKRIAYVAKEKLKKLVEIVDD